MPRCPFDCRSTSIGRIPSSAGVAVAATAHPRWKGFCNKDINQPTGATSSRGAQPAFNMISDVTKQASTFGLPSTHYAGLFFNYVDLNSLTYNVVPGGGATGGNAAIGGLTNQTFGHQYN